MPKVLISDALSPRAAEIFVARGIELDLAPGVPAEEVKARIAGCDGLAVRSATKVTAGLIERAENLKVIGRAGIGVDNIDVAAATQRGIVVMNTPYGNSITAAEHTIAMLFALCREIPAADRSTQAGKWEKSRFMGVELTGKTLGVIGCGNVGSIVAERARGLRMKVIAYDPFLSPERAVDLGIEKVSLDALLARADFITLHTPLTETTKNLIDAGAIANMKRGVRLVNCARGGLIVEYDGAVAELNVKPLTAVALTGLLSPQLATVNMVNAPEICRERDIRVSETRRAEPVDYQTLIRVIVTTERRIREVAGTLFAGDKPRIVSVEGIPLEAELGGNMLFVRNYDKPGFIGALGNALGDGEVNIATFHLGRAAPGQDAIALVEVDQPLTPAILDTVRALPNVIQVKSLRF